MKTFWSGLVLAAALTFAGGAQSATVYSFAVDYSGGGNAVLAGGSDPMVGTDLAVGDSFTYTLSAVGAGEWHALTADPLFPFLALAIDEPGLRTGDFTIELKNNGVTVFTYAETGAQTSEVHLGSNSVAVPLGLVWDQWVLTDTLTAAVDLTQSFGVGSTIGSIKPWPGTAPEDWFNGAVSFTTGVPEPAEWAMLLLGFGTLGVALRARRRLVVA